MIEHFLLWLDVRPIFFWSRSADPHPLCFFDFAFGTFFKEKLEHLFINTFTLLFLHVNIRLDMPEKKRKFVKLTN